jgi:hypothetical protein
MMLISIGGVLLGGRHLADDPDGLREPLRRTLRASRNETSGDLS